MQRKKIVILGSGFSSLAAAAYLAKAGFGVTILEKNKEIGGRARQLVRDGFVFDMGPSFYWMPDVFSSFFGDFGKKVEDVYDLKRLDPGYRVYFGEHDYIDNHADFEKLKQTFEQLETGGGRNLQKFIDKAGKNYDIAIKDLVYKPALNIFEIVTRDTIFKLNEFVSTISRQVRAGIRHQRLRTILEFPVLFLGSKPSNTPAFYNFMNFADIKLGTWHPMGGMFAVVKAMEALTNELGVEILTGHAVNELVVKNRKVVAARTDHGDFNCDVLLSGADYHHTETLLPQSLRQYSEGYWDSRTFAPSALMYYVGFNKKLVNLEHHTLFFEPSFDKHAESIYDNKKWPVDPLFYASFPSKTDPGCAPEGKEAAVFLIPIAPGLKHDDQKTRTKYLDIIIERIERNTGQSVKDEILFSESFSVSDFVNDYNSYKGNAYGLANILLQTHILRPRLKSKKLDNLYFTGQLTVPGPGVPPSLISGKIVSNLISDYERS
ncbi:MAG TPA: phytoene desaturase [Saprospirales bacterium]|nr:phytoene desaturase [Saprospirales bacterium]HRQ28971.1 phytoene desaturase family protein [Saprospiraceae bacterium]